MRLLQKVWCMHREGDEDFPEGVEEEFPLEVEDAEVDLVVLVVVKQSAVEKEEMKQLPHQAKDMKEVQGVLQILIKMGSSGTEPSI